MNEKTRNAWFLGGLCSVSYLAVYIARNVLSAVTPQMTELGVYSEELIGTMSSLFFVAYGVGQLINGMIGDKIKAKYMISFGLLLAGISNLLFPLLTHLPYVNLVAYGLTGFFLSMIYGPMTKIVSENTTQALAVRCSLGYTFASLLGSPAAGLLAATLTWQSVFAVSSAALIGMAVIGFVLFTVLEQKKIVQYGRFASGRHGVEHVQVLFRRQIVKFSIVAFLTGIVRTSVVFWLPTYFSRHLGYSSTNAALIFTVATLVISTSTFVAVFIYERLHSNMNLSVFLMFAASAVFFALTYCISAPVANIVCIVLAVLCGDGASAILWSVYCPSLRDTGIVSSVTGFLDFLSYMGAAIANVVFANMATRIGWGNLLLVWFGLMMLGVIACLPFGKKTKQAE